MVAEWRATQADVEARRHFTPEKEPIVDARGVIDGWIAPALESLETRAARSTTSLSKAAQIGLIEVG